MKLRVSGADVASASPAAKPPARTRATFDRRRPDYADSQHAYPDDPPGVSLCSLRELGIIPESA